DVCLFRTLAIHLLTGIRLLFSGGVNEATAVVRASGVRIGSFVKVGASFASVVLIYAYLQGCFRKITSLNLARVSMSFIAAASGALCLGSLAVYLVLLQSYPDITSDRRKCVPLFLDSLWPQEG